MPKLTLDLDLIDSGNILVPPGVDTSDFAEMESLFRRLLWPYPGAKYRRHRRKLWFVGRHLHYEIYDTPAGYGEE